MVLVLELPNHHDEGGEEGADQAGEPLVVAEQQVEADDEGQDDAHVDQQELQHQFHLMG